MILEHKFNKAIDKHEKVILRNILNEALATDGEHHKQWYLHQIAKLYKIDIDEDVEQGIAP